MSVDFLFLGLLKISVELGLPCRNFVPCFSHVSLFSCFTFFRKRAAEVFVFRMGLCKESGNETSINAG